MKMILVLVCTVILSSGSCAFDKYYFIRIQNTSSETIRACGAYILPDTLLPKEQLYCSKILPGKSNVVQDHILNDYKLKRFETEKVTIFIIDEQVFQTVPWDTIRKYNMVLKRYELNREDYNNLQQKFSKAWALPYP